MNEQRQLTAIIIVLYTHNSTIYIYIHVYLRIYEYLYSIFVRTYCGNEPADEPLLCYTCNCFSF